MSPKVWPPMLQKLRLLGIAVSIKYVSLLIVSSLTIRGSVFIVCHIIVYEFSNTDYGSDL
jgi:hypothetical protein